MNWINNVVPPKIRSFLTTKRELPDNLWRTCPVTGQMVFHKDLEANQFVFPGSDYHDRMGAQERLAHLFDDRSYDCISIPEAPTDPLKFRDGRRYTDRLREAKGSTELDDSVLVGEGTLEGRPVVAAAQDFRFMAGSLGMAAAEAVIAGMLHAVERKKPFILFAASGGARMQEGIISLMQMPRTTIAVQRLRDARLPYIVVLTDPTTGGVTASYAMLGDIHIAEPGALICFAGPRVIQQTIREKLPEGFQRSEYLLEHGMIDMVVHRHKLRETLATVCDLLTVKYAEESAGARRARTAKVDEHQLNGSRHASGESEIDMSNSQGDALNGAANGSGAPVDAEPVDDDDRFDTTRPSAKSDQTIEGTEPDGRAHKAGPNGDAKS